MNLPDFFGLDIGNHSIKVVEIKRKNDTTAELEKIGQAPVSESLLDTQGEAQTQVLVDKIKEAVDSAEIGAKKVVAALPEASIFSRIITVPNIEGKRLEDSIFYEAKQYLPIPLADAQIDYMPAGKKLIEGKEFMQIFLVAAPKTIVEKYINIMNKAQLEVIAIETESIATTRSVTFANSFIGSQVVMDFGSKGADLSVVKDDKLIFSQSIGTGSDMLTKAIATEYNLEYNQAEQYKRTYGLLTDQAEGKIALTLNPIMEIIVNEIVKMLNYFKAHIQESTPSRIYITGDGAKLPGITNFLSQRLAMETLLFDPLAKLKLSSKLQSEASQLGTAGFTVATGLALKVE